MTNRSASPNHADYLNDLWVDHSKVVAEARTTALLMSIASLLSGHLTIRELSSGPLGLTRDHIETLEVLERRFAKMREAEAMISFLRENALISDADEVLYRVGR
ncbi:hypothetical protein [Qipengyuania gelatinilytica]|uniref:Uncharacterized protein n=1 Tax=Qipengyuania gelatinilytica TaxID=2867231 RepID=A0ABX9A4M4_9SPHN|nr:hypothetical protein [Qipengyuania gelatinilytica]QZD96225.1 hypothetical protein K3136_05915 [Qipengyuania gelatinilytica]